MVVILVPHVYFAQPPGEIVEILLSGTGKAYAYRGRQRAHQGIYSQLPGIDQAVGRNRKGRHIPVKGVRQDSRRHRRDDHSAKVGGLKLAENDLQGKNRARDRCIKDGCDAAGCAR